MNWILFSIILTYILFDCLHTYRQRIKMRSILHLVEHHGEFTHEWWEMYYVLKRDLGIKTSWKDKL